MRNILGFVYNGLFCCKKRSLAKNCLPIRLSPTSGDSRDVSVSDATVLAGFSEEISDEKPLLCDNRIGRKNCLFFHSISQSIGIENKQFLSQSPLFSRRTTKCKQTLFIILCTFFLTSCGGLLAPVKVRPISIYTFASWAKKTADTHKTTTSKTLLVTAPTASPGYASSDMIYVVMPFQLRAFSEHQWVAPPAQLLLPLMATQLRALHYFHVVVTAPFSGNADYQLNLRLLTLQQEFLQPQSKVRFTIEATVQSMQTGKVIADRVFETLVPTLQNAPYDGVLATNIAVHQTLAQIARFVRTSVISTKHDVVNP